jgi:bifunctional UDP-N-acetylglucosamine pyrophosphorylase/glucosamine-1-phosphate N-acetyltransferase
MSDIAVIILAAGEGTRMKSSRAKVLHEIAGVPMIRYVVETAMSVAEEIIVVIGYQAEAVRRALVSYPMLRFAVQEEQLGTGHAVMCAVPHLSPGIQDVVILCGDAPLIRSQTVRDLIDQHRLRDSSLSLVSMTIANPFGYGRIVLNQQGEPVGIVEESDATEAEKRIRLVNTGTYCVSMVFLTEALESLKNDNIQGEFYLTDVVGQAYRQRKPAVLLEARDATEVMGVNTREELARATRYVLRSEGRDA